MSNSGSGAYPGPGSRYLSPLANGPFSLESLEMLQNEAQSAQEKHPGKTMLDNISDKDRLSMIVEEMGEVAECLTYDKEDLSRDGLLHLRDELIQLANVSLAWAQFVSADVDKTDTPATSEMWTTEPTGKGWPIAHGEAQSGADYAGSTAPEERAPSDAAQHPDYMGAREAREDIRDSQGPVRVVTRRGDDAGAAPIFEDMSTRRGDRLHGLPLRGE